MFVDGLCLVGVLFLRPELAVFGGRRWELGADGTPFELFFQLHGPVDIGLGADCSTRARRGAFGRGGLCQLVRLLLFLDDFSALWRTSHYKKMTVPESEHSSQCRPVVSSGLLCDGKSICNPTHNV